MADKIFTVDRFLGLNESADGTTELKLGEASKIENFMITDEYNLKSRPGIVRAISEHRYKWVQPFYLCGKPYLACIVKENESSVDIFHGGEKVYTVNDRAIVKNLFLWNGHITILFDNGVISTQCRISYLEVKEDGGLNAIFEEPYTPLAITQASPSGGGTSIEPLNILTDLFRVVFTADGTQKYVLPKTASAVSKIIVDGDPNAIYMDESFFDKDTHTYTFSSNEGYYPKKGAEVEFVCITDDEDLHAARERFFSMRYHEYYNGATDTRIFFYGDGTNLCYYTGVPAHGSGFYVPAGNELTVDFSDSPITGLVRHYSRLLAFKPDGVDAISYEPVTLADGSVIAGFYLRPVSREYGNEAIGQVELVNNYARTFSQGSIYEWRISSSSYRDERYSKCISQKVSKSIVNADLSKVVACDDDRTKTYYVFLNDEEGTVLVNRYDLEVWSIYRSALAVGVTHAFVFDSKVLFLRDGELFTFDPESTFDAPVKNGGDIQPIQCVWESGYMAFGADFKRKYSSNLWVSMLPEGNSRMEITVQTDRRDEYLEKVTGLPLLDFTCIDFSNFSFLRSMAPKIKRIKIKVKKFVYYKLIFRVTQAGAKATVLGYDQQVRYSSNVK